MARKFTWKDFLPLIRYQKQQLFLNNTHCLVFNPGLFSSNLLSITAPSSGFCTAVQSLNEGLYPYLLGQIYHPTQSSSARLIFLAPGDLGSHPDYGELLAHLTTQAGERGAVQILAEVLQDSVEEEVLIQAGFKIYAEQQIWRLPVKNPLQPGRGTWVPISQKDQMHAGAIYKRIIPGSIQRVEPSPTFTEVEGLLFWQEKKPAGFAETRFGPKGILVDVVMEPEISGLDEVLAGLFFHLPYRNTRDVYLRVRSYQERIASALEELGVMPGPEQKALVKRLAVHYNAKQTFTYQAFEKRPDVIKPVSNIKIKK